MSLEFDRPPSRFKESNFRRFEDTIRTIVTNWPRSSVFKPLNLSIETFAARLRDAVTAYLKLECLWQSDIDKDQLRKIWSAKNVRMTDEGTVVVGLPVGRKHTNIVYSEETDSGQRTVEEIIFDKCTGTEVIWIAGLLNSGKLSIPFRLTNPQFPDIQLDALQEMFPNISYQQTPTGLIIL